MPVTPPPRLGGKKASPAEWGSKLRGYLQSHLGDEVFATAVGCGGDAGRLLGVLGETRYHRYTPLLEQLRLAEQQGDGGGGGGRGEGAGKGGGGGGKEQ